MFTSHFLEKIRYQAPPYHTSIPFHLRQNTDITSSSRRIHCHLPGRWSHWQGYPSALQRRMRLSGPWKNGKMEKNPRVSSLVFISKIWWTPVDWGSWEFGDNCTSEDLKNSLLLLNVCLGKKSGSWPGFFFNHNNLCNPQLPVKSLETNTQNPLFSVRRFPFCREQKASRNINGPILYPSARSPEHSHGSLPLPHLAPTCRLGRGMQLGQCHQSRPHMICPHLEV